jgi:uncharacterized protein YyaL (SSP411 family)
LWDVREKRVKPFKDDKILSSWNGLMIYSLCEAGAAFQEPRFLEAAVKAARFIRTHLWKNGRLLRRFRAGQSHYEGALDEYAFLIRGLISLYEANQGTEWLVWAMEMCRFLRQQYKSEGGAFYQTDGKDPNIILRRCLFSDGAEPSGNAVHAENLLRLGQLTNDPEYAEQAEDVFKAVKPFMEAYPPGFCFHLMNLLRYYDRQAPTIVIALNKKEDHFPYLYQHLFHHFIAHRALIWQKEEDTALHPWIHGLDAKTPQKGKTTLYICYQGICTLPLVNKTDMEEAIEKL